MCKINNSESGVNYSLVELPLSAALAAYYLAMNGNSVNLNGASISLSGDSKGVINIYTSNSEAWKNSEYDLIINTRSMMEMNTTSIAFYFDVIQHKACKIGGYFLNINCYQKK